MEAKKDWVIFNGSKGNIEQNENQYLCLSASKATDVSVILNCINDPSISIHRRCVIEASGKRLYHKTQYS